jgi:hypothetical protein
MTLDFAYDATYKKPEKKKTENNDEAERSKFRVLSDRLAIELGNSKTYNPKILAQQVATCFVDSFHLWQPRDNVDL